MHEGHLHEGHFYVEGKKFDLPVFAGLTTPTNIREFAEQMGWIKWEFICLTLGIIETA